MLEKKGQPVTDNERDLVALAELQQFIISELGESVEETSLRRAFSPITSGLGLESPKEKVANLFAAKPNPRTVSLDVDWEAQPSAPIILEEEAPESKKSASSVNQFLSAMGKEELLRANPDLATPLPSLNEPPPLPTPSVFRQLLTICVDQFFVLSLFSLAVFLTFKVQAEGSFRDIQTFSQLANTFFLRMVMLEFAAIWLGYLAISIGVLSMTFGMWVWGLRVNYDNDQRDSQFLKKVMRVVWSFFFLAPVLPALVLVVQRKGRNLLDLLSGTTLYRHAA